MYIAMCVLQVEYTYNIIIVLTIILPLVMTWCAIFPCEERIQGLKDMQVTTRITVAYKGIL